MDEYPIWDPFDRVLWGFAFLVGIIGAMFYLKKAQQQGEVKQKRVLISYAVLLSLFSVGMVFFFLNDLLVPGTFRNLTFYGIHDISIPIYEILFKLGWSCIYVAFGLFTLIFELNDRRTKFVLTIISVINLLIFIIVPLPSVRELAIDVYVFSYSALSFWIVISIYAKWSDMDSKVVSSYFLLFALFSGWGFILNMNEVKENNFFPLFFAPLWLWVGMVFSMIPLFVKPKGLRNSLVMWHFLMMFNIILWIIMISLIYQNFETYVVKYTLTPAFFLIAAIIIELINLKDLLSFYKDDDQKPKKESQESIFSMFTKPQNLTEEEISISKERKVCLVCKGKVLGFNSFICKCDAIYCQKCARTLSELENACWVCNAALDETKPVKLDKDDQLKQVEIQEDNKLKKAK